MSSVTTLGTSRSKCTTISEPSASVSADGGVDGGILRRAAADQAGVLHVLAADADGDVPADPVGQRRMVVDDRRVQRQGRAAELQAAARPRAGSTVPMPRFIGGEPMKPATKMLAGLS